MFDSVDCSTSLEAILVSFAGIVTHIDAAMYSNTTPVRL